MTTSVLFLVVGCFAGSSMDAASSRSSGVTPQYTARAPVDWMKKRLVSLMVKPF